MIRAYEFISCFRALAALWVLVAHCMIWGGWYGVPLPSAKIAVNLFMLISGFLMMSNATQRSGEESFLVARDWWRFLLRRYFRLAPAYYLSLALAVCFSSYFLLGYKELQLLNPALWGTSGGGVYDPMRIEYTPLNIFLHITFIFGLHPEYSFSSFLPDWSLSLEMQFYVLFPLLFLIFSRVGVVRSSLFIGVPVSLFGVWVASKVTYFEPSLLILRLNYFLAGMVLFSAIEVGLSWLRRLVLVVCALFLIFIESRLAADSFVLPFISLLMFFVGVMEVNWRVPSWLCCVINNRLVRFASDTSYGVYLFHGFFISAAGIVISKSPFLSAISPFERVSLMIAFVLPMSYLVAYFVYRVVEVPGIRLGKKVIDSVLSGERKPVPV